MAKVPTAINVTTARSLHVSAIYCQDVRHLS